MYDKKTIAIIILILIIIGLVWTFFPGKSQVDTVIESLRKQYSQLLRSTAVIESENSRIRIESAELRANNIQSEENNRKLESENIDYKRIIDSLRIGSQESENYLSEYGRINSDFAEFIRSAEITD
ncbi:MAG: hypothetical protein PF570_10185 [Candidatus Cloacimonetes bacterium]|jgi:predicted PurR-regulated permease PerM|nr:hypothetical protein [Candidatus Cloacimonadota bacterium]